MGTESIERVRRICLELPEAAEKEAWHEPTWRVRNRVFAMFASSENHHGAGRDAVWLPAPEGAQQMLTEVAPERFFVPPYVGPSGWIGVWLDGDVDWAELRELVADSYRLVAPKKLAARLG